jgi:hypothetical protein
MWNTVHEVLFGATAAEAGVLAAFLITGLVLAVGAVAISCGRGRRS